MRRSISSIFILLLLLLTLWGISAWYLGTKTKEKISSLLTDVQEQNKDLFNYELLSYESSIFGAKAELALRLSNNNSLLSQIDKSFDVIYLDAIIQNGPLLIDSSGISLGSSIWKVRINSAKDGAFAEEFRSITQSSSDQSSLDDFEVMFKTNFEGDVNYQMPLTFNASSILVEGTYNAQKFSNIGKVTAENWSFRNKNLIIKAQNIHLKFKHILKSNEDRDIQLNADIPELFFHASSMKQALTLKVISDAKFSVNSEVLNADANIYFKNSQNSIYPIQRSDVKIKVNSLNINDLIVLVNSKARITHLNQQIGWVLEEQGELPEGQVKLWQLEDELHDQQKVLASALSNVIIEKRKGDSIFDFSIKSYSNNSNSYVKGALSMQVPSISNNNSRNKAFPNELSVKDNPSSDLTQLKADVTLDEAMYTFISTKLPIKDNKFKLIYKNNKLLMQ